VAEYWIVDPGARQIVAYALGADGRYAAIAPAENRIESRLLPGFFVRPDWFWGGSPVDAIDALAELDVRAASVDSSHNA